LEQLGALVKEGLVVGDPDVLEHSHRDDAIKALREVAVIAQLEMHILLQSGGVGALGRHLVLLGRKSNAQNVGLERFGYVEAEAAPTRADVEYSLARHDPELGGDVPLFRKLRLLQRHVRAFKIGAGILHVVVEEESIEVTRQIVMTLDVAPRAPLGVPLLERSRLQA